MRIDNERLPLPTEDELINFRKWAYRDRIWKEVDNDKYGLTPLQFSEWMSKTYNEKILNNKHITYRESLKLS